MKQIKIGLTERQNKVLRKESVTLGIPLAELIRRILDKHMDGKQ
jgi:hypothetical protein